MPKTLKKPKFLTLSFYCITLSIICQAFLPILPVSAATASVNSFYFKNYQADYYLSQADDGTSRLRVVEEFTAVFPSSNQNHGLTRVIPYTNQDGQNLTMVSDNYLEINVWHNGIEERPYKIEGGDGYFTVYLGDASTYVHGEQIYKLEYEFRNVITKFDEDGKKWQELYWDTNGNDWSQRFENVTVNLHFEDSKIASAFTGDAWCYVGRYGSSDQSRCKITQSSDGLTFTANKLSARENLTFDVEFQPDTFTVPGQRYDYTVFFIFIIELLVTIAILIAFFVCYQQSKAKREYYQGLFVKPEYTPPQGFSVAEMAENYIKSGSLGNSKVATLMELAVKGKVEIRKLESKTKLGKTKTMWRIRVKSIDLSAEQITMLRILAGGKTNISVGDDIEVKAHTATNSLIKLGQDFARQTRDALRKKGLMESNPKAKGSAEPNAKNPCGTLVAITSVLAFISIFVNIFVLDDDVSYRAVLGGTPLIITVFALPWLVLIISVILSSKLSPYFTMTEKGLMYSKYLDGLKLYIKMAEKDRIEFLQSVKGADTSHQGIVKLYEKLLPYAVIFKLEKSWLGELSRYYEYKDVSAPTWYFGVGAFSAHDFSAAMLAASSSIATSTTHSTTSNSSSGFSGGGGGGFSGGGGGGGGGGGW